MNGFIIDQQSLRDLNIFSETSNSVFHIFKGTRMPGGREKLREMMSNPLKVKDVALSFIRNSAFLYPPTS